MNGVQILKYIQITLQIYTYVNIQLNKIFKKELNKQTKMNTITRSKAVELIKNSQGRFFTVSFTKKDNTERTINGRTKVTKGSKGGKNPAINLGYISVYSTKEKGYRNVNSQTITSLKINGETYRVK